MNRVAARTVAVMAAVLAGGCARVAKPTADEILAKNVAARGGLDAWRKVHTMVWIGHVESAHAPIPGIAFTLQQKRPNLERMDINARGEKSVRIFDGSRGWKVRDVNGRPDVQPFTPQEIKYAQAGHGIDGPLIECAAKGSSVTLEGIDRIGDRNAYHLSVRLLNGGAEHIWVDSETWLELRDDRIADGPGGAQRRVTATYDDYRHVQGLQIPFVIQTGGAAGTKPDRMQIERVVLNAPLDDSRFENPAAPRPHRSRRDVADQAFAPATPGQREPE